MFTAKSSPEIQLKIKSLGFREPAFLSDIDSKTLGSESKSMCLKKQSEKAKRAAFRFQVPVEGKCLATWMFSVIVHFKHLTTEIRLQKLDTNCLWSKND